MTSRVLIRRHDVSMSLARSCLSAVLLLSTAAWPQSAASPSAGKFAAAALQARLHPLPRGRGCGCLLRRHSLESRRSLTSGFTGDALDHANRPADAIRNYRRAAALAPTTRGLAAKISATEAKLPDAEQDINPVIQQPQAALFECRSGGAVALMRPA